MQRVDCRVDSRKDFMLYLCTLHNIVNRTLLKPVYPCNIELLEERAYGLCGVLDVGKQGKDDGRG